MLRLSALAVILFSFGSIPLTAQNKSVEFYPVRVTTQDGSHFRGVIYDVTARDLYLNYKDINRRYIIPLSLIRKVVIHYKKRKSTIEGAVLGGGFLAFLAIKSSRQNGFRSPALFGVNLVLATAAGAAAGALIGKNIGPRARQTILPFGQTPEQVNDNLRRQLEPFTYTYQTDILNRVPQ